MDDDHAQRVVEAVAARRVAECLADAERHVVTEDAERRCRRLKAIGQAHPQRAAAIARRAVELVGIARVGHAGLEPIGDRPFEMRRERARPTVGHRGNVGVLRPLTGLGVAAAPERGDHREDLGARHAARHSTLRGRVPAHDFGDVELHDRVGLRELEELRGGPHERALRHALEHFDRGAERAASEQRPEARADATHHRQLPAQRIVGCLQPEELHRVQNAAA